MEFGQLMIDILVYVSCKFEMYIFRIALVISENVRIAFLYVLSIYKSKMRFITMLTKMIVSYSMFWLFPVCIFIYFLFSKSGI